MHAFDHSFTYLSNISPLISNQWGKPRNRQGRKGPRNVSSAGIAKERKEESLSLFLCLSSWGGLNKHSHTHTHIHTSHTMSLFARTAVGLFGKGKRVKLCHVRERWNRAG